MYGYYYPGSFYAKKYDKAKYKPKKIANTGPELIQLIKNLNTALKQFNDDFQQLNSVVGSDQWSGDAADISAITDDINEKFLKIGTNIVEHLSDAVTQVADIDYKQTSAAETAKSAMEGSLSRLQGVNR